MVRCSTPGPRTANGMPAASSYGCDLESSRPVLAQQVAVVGDEEDPRPPELAGPAKDVQHLADLVVDVLQLLQLGV